MRKESRLVISFVIAMMVALVTPAHSEVLWYNGDIDYYNGLLNTTNSYWPLASVYDNFTVGGGGWTVNYVWSNNVMDYFNVTQAMWEIRSGVSHENGGTLVAGGTGTATQTPTGRSGFQYNEYTIMVSGLNVHLDPGTYWLTVIPVGHGNYYEYPIGGGTSFIPTTSGTNSVNAPGDNGNSYFNMPDYPYNNDFDPIGSEAYSYFTHRDFSMGIGSDGGGSAVPEPATMALFGIGSAALAFMRKRKRA